MKKALYILSILVLASSCKAAIEPLRIQTPETFWEYNTDDQTARVCFTDDEHVSILQLDISSGYTQSIHGTYQCNGHSVICNGTDWPNQVKFVRTFSHLKNNSTNKNLTPLAPQSHGTVSGSVWAALVNRDFHLAIFLSDKQCVDGVYKNVIQEEGIPYGWEWKKSDYELNGNQLKAGPFKATLFDRFLVVDTLAVMAASLAPQSTKTSSLTGTVWTYETSGAPGAIVFTSDKEFTRLLVSSKIVHESDSGTYSLKGTSLEMTLDDKKETCQIDGGRFTFFEKTYAKVTLP
ncbi:MAG: hypothetical protein J5745_05210 [Bacteroidales bacterium]|nr:hypothetical protein [Bacteroidales bacterium]